MCFSSFVESISKFVWLLNSAYLSFSPLNVTIVSYIIHLLLSYWCFKYLLDLDCME